MTPWSIAHQALVSMDFPGKNTGVGCHSLLNGRDLQPRDQALITCIAADSLLSEAPGNRPLRVGENNSK